MPNIKNKRLVTSYFSIVIIMSIVLFLYSFFGLFLISSDSIINKFKEDFTVSIYLKENVKNIEINQLKNELLMSNFIDIIKFKYNSTILICYNHGLITSMVIDSELISLKS